MYKIKLLICYHKMAPLFKDDILTPIHVGRANAKKRMNHESETYKWLTKYMIGDDTGSNISEKNDSYNEMTALYWAWKNYKVIDNPNYIGLMHYRRHFVFKENSESVYNIQSFNINTYYDTISYSKENLYQLIEGCDFLTHIGKVNNVYRHFVENQRKEDIDLANSIVVEKFPEYSDIMKVYYQGDNSNFCNMFIFSKKIFFEYCEFIFTILKEFETRTDISEKRLFISERLTGIFIHKLMCDKKLRYKIIPITFIDEATSIPIILSIEKGSELSTVVAITSILENAKEHHSYQFYLLGKGGESEDAIRKYRLFETKYNKCKIEFIDYKYSMELLPLLISELLPNINKCIYLSGQVIALCDIGEFFRICSTDDYFIVGIPQENYNPEEKIKRIENELLVLNCKRMRKHKIAEKAKCWINSKYEIENIINQICMYEIGYIPWYLFTSERLSKYGINTLDNNKTRIEIQKEALWKPFLVYDYSDPIENNQGVYSIFWWNILKRIPLSFQILDINLLILENLYALQQIEINTKKEEKELIDYKQLVNINKNEVVQEVWKTYGLFGKLKFYYKHNGLKNTILYISQKIGGKGKR